MTRLRTILLFTGLAIFLIMINLNIYQTEQIIKDSTPVYLELIPVDPFSLIQGYYMALDYQIERDAEDDGLRHTHRGKIVIKVDENKVAHYVRKYVAGDTLKEGEMLINYHTRGGGWQVYIGASSFLFQEDLAEFYENAVYAEVRIANNGTIILIDLVGQDFENLIP